MQEKHIFFVTVYTTARLVKTAWPTEFSMPTFTDGGSAGDADIYVLYNKARIFFADMLPVKVTIPIL